MSLSYNTTGSPAIRETRCSIMKKILVVDDELKIVQVIRDYLEGAGFAVRVARDGKNALALIRSDDPDLILLDLGLPEMDGLDVAREIRKYSNIPLIMLT